MHNPKNPTVGRGFEINASNWDDLGPAMESLRSEWEALGRKDEEYAKALFEKFESEA